MGGLGNFIQGAGGGALGGSSFGVPGALIGGVLGGLGGLFGGDSEADKQRALQMKFYNEMSNQGPAAQGQYSEFRNNQKNFINNLENQAAGRGPSLAAEQLKAATDRSTKQSQGLAQSGQGNPLAAMMMAQEASGQMGAQNAQTAAAARMQEQLNAQGQLGQAIWSGRSSDEDMNRFNASQTNNYNQNNNQLRAMVLGGMGQGANGVSTGQQILSGGAGMFGARMLGRGGNPGKANPGANPRLGINPADGLPW